MQDPIAIIGAMQVEIDQIVAQLDNGTLVEIPLKTPVPPRVIGFAYNPAGETRTMQRFIDFVNSLPAQP